MIRVTKLGIGTERYYLEPVTAGWEAPGRWVGAGAAALGLGGPVRSEELRSVLELTHPTEGTALRRASPIRAYDLTVSDPKSVSVAWALGAPGTAAAVMAAREASLTATVGYLEAHACRARGGLPAAGMVGAAFAHRTSRAGDPHLHTHLLVMNLAGPMGPGRWGALDGLVLVAQARTAGYLYQADLRHQISRSLGLDWGEVRYGVAQLSAVSPELRGLFSRRRAQVEEGMARHHGSSPASARLAALVDRPERDGSRSAVTMAPEWRRRAEAAGLAPVGPSGPAPPGLPRPAPISPAPADLGLDGLSSFSRAELLEALSGAAGHGAPLGWVEAEADRILASPGTERISGRAPLRRRDVMRRPGVTVPIPTEEARWRTSKAARAEEALARVALRRVDAGAAMAPAAAFTRGLDEEAAGVVLSLTGSGAGVELVAGGPGARLDGVLAAAHRAWTSAGHRVVVAAPDGVTRARIEGAGLSITDTGRLDEGLARVRRPMPGTVIVALGAESTPAPILARLAASTERSGAKLVLVGDPGPLRDVDRAGGWRSAEAAVGARVLSRTRAPLQLEPNRAEMAAGRLAPWLVMAPTPDAARDRLVTDWMSEGPAAAMVASRRAD
ncbi:MAG: MobF family relaxase, partial [Acidimicrobiales bacterium]